MKRTIFLLFFIASCSVAFAINSFSFGNALQQAIELFPEKDYSSIRREATRHSNWFYDLSSEKAILTVNIGEIGGAEKALLLSFDISKILKGNFQGDMNFIKIPENTLQLIPFEKEGQLQVFSIGEDFISVKKTFSDLESKIFSGIEVPERRSIDLPLDMTYAGNIYSILAGGRSVSYYLFDKEGQLFEKKICESSTGMYRVPRMIRSSKYSNASFATVNIYPENSVVPKHSQIIKIDEPCKILFSSENQVIGAAALDNTTDTFYVVLFSIEVKEDLVAEIIAINIHSEEIKKVSRISQKIADSFDRLLPFTPWLMSVEKDYIGITSVIAPEFSGRINRRAKEWEGAKIDKNAIKNAVFSFYNSGKLISILNERDEKNPLGKFSVNIYDFDKKPTETSEP